MKNLAALLALLFGMCNQQPAPITEADLQQMEDEIDAMVGDGTCASDSCATAPVGSKPCGGPWRWVVYCADSVDEVALLELIDEHAAAEEQYNIDNGILSDCAVELEPAVVWLNGQCIVDGDDDFDSVPNSADVCPGFNDLADMDGDGIPDDCDTCDDDLSLCTYQDILDMEDAIDDRVGDGSCPSNTCTVAPFGSKPCGGPWDHVVYCAETVDEPALLALLDQHAEAQHLFNIANGAMSDCAIEMPPRVSYQNGQCVY